jgi:hypothetical protein
MDDNLTSSGASAPVPAVDDAVVAVVGDSMLEKRAKKINKNKSYFSSFTFFGEKSKNNIKTYIFMNGLHPKNDSFSDGSKEKIPRFVRWSSSSFHNNILFDPTA